MKNYIAQWRDYRRIRQDELGAAIGKSGATVSRYESGKQAVSTDILARIAQILECSLTDLLESPPPQGLVGAPVAELTPADVAPPLLQQMPRDMPVHGTVEGGPGVFIDTRDNVDFVRRPPGLVGAQNAYALYVVGESMAPKYEPGNLIFVHPDRPPMVGDDVVVQLQGGNGEAGQAMIKRLVRRTASLIRLRQFNPDEELEISRDRVAAIHKVMTAAELMGV